MFDYKSFAQNMVNQSKNLIPADFSQDEKDYISSTIGRFVKMSGEALNKEFDDKINDEQKVFMTQVLAEWTFHKAADVIRSGIPRKNWDSVMQKIAYTVFEVTKEGLLKGLSQEQLLDAVEQHVKKCYTKAVEDLHNKNIITKEIEENAIKQSNMDAMIQECEEKKKENLEQKNKLKNVLHVLTDLFIGFFNKRNKTKKLEKELEDVDKQFQDLIDPDRMYDRLGVDVLCLQVGMGLLSLVDPDQGGELLAHIVAMRQRLTDEYGYIIPNVRIMDSAQLNEYEYQIDIRNNRVSNGFVYPDKYMVIADQWDKVNDDLPQDSIIGVDQINQLMAYWITPETAKSACELPVVSPTDVIIKHMEKIFLEYVDEILTVTDIKKLISLVEADDSLKIKGLLNKVDYPVIREILCNLIREKISIKDITLIFSRLAYFVQYTTEPDELSEKLRQVLANQICNKFCDEDSIIWAVDISEQIEQELLKNLRTQKGLEKTLLDLDENYGHDLIEKIALKLTETYRKIDRQPVILCDEKIRLGLYRLLVKYIPTITVLSKQETSNSLQIKIEIVDTIE